MRSLSDAMFVFGRRVGFCKSGGSARKVRFLSWVAMGTTTAVCQPTNFSITFKFHRTMVSTRCTMIEIQIASRQRERCEIVLQLDEQVGYMRIEITVGGFPILLVVEAELFRLRLFGGATGSWNGICVIGMRWA